MRSVSVSNLDLYRFWRGSEDLDLDWLLRRLRGEEPQTEPMKAGEALHAALERSDVGETEILQGNGYLFRFLTDCAVEIPIARELSISKTYGELRVRGRVDGMSGNQIVDYKTTQSFDADRLLEGYQWRFYLAMTGCDSFLWKVFVLSEEAPNEFNIVTVHELRQHRYDGLDADCERLAAQFCEFSKRLDEAGLAWTRAQPEPTPAASAATEVAQ